MPDIKAIADRADMIVNGYAFERKLTEAGSAKFFVKANGDAILQNRGILTDREINKITQFIKANYQDMYITWANYSKNGYFGK